jgi:PPOX class probable F420-dependent enzyme
MLDDEVRALLEGANIAHVATILPDGGPHVVPVWVGREGEHVAIFTGPRTVKARNLDRDPRVALSINKVDEVLRMASIRGRVHERMEGKPAWEIIDRMSHTYQGRPYPRDEELVVYLIEPERTWARDFGEAG